MCIKVLSEFDSRSTHQVWKVLYLGPTGVIPGPFSAEILAYNVWHTAQHAPAMKTAHEKLVKHARYTGAHWLWKEDESIIGFSVFPRKSDAEAYLRQTWLTGGVVFQVGVRGKIIVGSIDSYERGQKTVNRVAWLCEKIFISDLDIRNPSR
jgi:hypothetical protein